MHTVKKYTLKVKTVKEHESKLVTYEHGSVLHVKEGAHLIISVENNSSVDADVQINVGCNSGVRHVRVMSKTVSHQHYDHTSETKITATHLLHLDDAVGHDLERCCQHSNVSARVVPAMEGADWESESHSEEDGYTPIPYHARGQVVWLQVPVLLVSHDFS